MEIFPLSEAWGTVISGFLTFSGAFVIAFVGPWFLSRKFHDLNDAADHVRSAVTEIRDKLEILNAATDAISRVESTLNNVSDKQEAEDNTEEQPAANFRQQLKSSWDAIQQKINSIASSPDIDGRRRAKYVRFDKRKYNKYIELLEKDGLLGDAAPYYEAAEIWGKYKTNRSPIDHGDLERINQLKEQICPENGGI